MAKSEQGVHFCFWNYYAPPPLLLLVLLPCYQELHHSLAYYYLQTRATGMSHFKARFGLGLLLVACWGRQAQVQM